MCEYCGEEPEPIINTDDLTVHVDALLGKLYANHYNGQMWECERVDIDYCPMCGRDLRGGGAMTPPKHPTVCNICGGKVSYVSNARVYGSRYGSGWCYLCESCGAYVGTHGPRPREAMGILADKRMRRLKMECHELFDRTWETNAERRERYARLANRLGIPVAECHFGYFDAPMLERALAILKEEGND